MEKAAPNKSLDDFLDEFGEKDPLAGLLSDGSEQLPVKKGPLDTTVSDDDTFDFPKKAQPYPKPSSSGPEKSPEKKVEKPTPMTSSANIADGTGLSFSDEDSLLDFAPVKKVEPKKSEPKVPPKSTQNTAASSKPTKFDSAAGLGLGFTDDDESEFTFSEAIKSNPNRTISPVMEEKRDDQWLNDFLGTKTSDEFAEKPKQKKSFETQKPKVENKPTIPEPKAVKEVTPPPVLITQKKLEAREPELNNPVPVPQPAEPQIEQYIPVHQKIEAPVHQNHHVLLVERQRDDAEKRLTEANHQINQLNQKLRTIEADNLDHVSRLKRIHAESVEMMKSEFEAQLARVKLIHADEMEAFKSAFGATSDVKDILVKVDNAAGSLFTIVKQLEERPNGGQHAECE